MSVKSINSASGFFRYQNLKILFFFVITLTIRTHDGNQHGNSCQLPCF